MNSDHINTPSFAFLVKAEATCCSVLFGVKLQQGSICRLVANYSDDLIVFREKISNICWCMLLKVFENVTLNSGKFKLFIHFRPMLNCRFAKLSQNLYLFL